MKNNIKIFLIAFICFLGVKNVYAQGSEQCQDITHYVDYTNLYTELSEDNDLKQFYNDFKTWFDSQNTYSYYLFYRQAGASSGQFYNRIVLYDTSYNLNYEQSTTNSYNYYSFSITYSDYPYIGYFNFDSNVFDSSRLAVGRSGSRNNNYNYDTGIYANTQAIYNNNYYWDFDSLTRGGIVFIKGTFVLIDTNLPISLIGTNYTSFKINDTYYCIGDNPPSLNDIFPFSGGGNVEPDPEPTPINNTFWTKATNTMTGLINITTSFYNALWNENTGIGKCICTIGLVNIAIALCYILFLRRHKV